LKPLTARERRLVAIGLLVAAMAVIWLGIIGPVIGGFADRAAERTRLQLAFQTNERLLAGLPAWRVAAERQRATADRFSIAATTERLAAEALKARIQRLAAEEGYTVTSIEDLAGDAPAGRIKVRADAELTLTQLCDSLRRLETEGAYVVVDFLSISADRALQSGREAPLDIRLELTADYRPAVGRPS
jgi:general secretion pathway protein M